MERRCDQCGDSYEPKRPSSKFCSARCRNRAARSRKRAPLLQLAPRPALEVDDEDQRIGIGAALLIAFKPDVLGTPKGAIAVKLARDVDRSLPGTPGYPALVQQLRGVLDDLSGSAVAKPVNPLTSIRERHVGQRASG